MATVATRIVLVDPNRTVRHIFGDLIQQGCCEVLVKAVHLIARCKNCEFRTVFGQSFDTRLVEIIQFAERVIGSIRCECVDHFIVLGEAHLRCILRTYARYYNDIRTHRSLDKDAPVSRPVQRTGIVSLHPILGGLDHHYVRVFGTHSEAFTAFP